MTCPRCRSPMKEQKGSFHKKRKWKCPRCGKVRLQIAKERRAHGSMDE